MVGKPNFVEVSRSELMQFTENYPRKLSQDICGISEPPLAGWYDFEATEGMDAMVAKFHMGPLESRRYYISRHLL